MGNMCPVMYQREKWVECEGEKCMVWDEERDMCGVLVGLGALANLAQSVKLLAEEERRRGRLSE